MFCFLEPLVGGVQLVEAGVLEGRVVHAGAGVLLGVVDEVREREECDPVVGFVVGHPGADLVLVDHLGADQGGVEVDHLLQPGGLEVEVVELGVNHGRSYERS